ncbi:hypothetical protein JB92DRAFT_1594702 [Gautieria morchelliformis]|nr:hypothetical protein JB92DRAFT_1594702 [Gautieria morchelliformis]
MSVTLWACIDALSSTASSAFPARFRVYCIASLTSPQSWPFERNYNNHGWRRYTVQARNANSLGILYIVLPTPIELRGRSSASQG